MTEAELCEIARSTLDPVPESWNVGRLVKEVLGLRRTVAVLVGEVFRLRGLVEKERVNNSKER